VREGFQLQLFGLGEYSAAMCQLTSIALRDATQALLNADLSLAEQVIAMDTQLDQMRSKGEQVAVGLLALQAPVARDLRIVVCALRIVADLHRMGVLAIHVANAARRRHPARVVPSDVRPFIERMSRIGVQLADQAEAVLRSEDLAAARRLRVDDDVMDGLQRDLYHHVLAPGWRHGVAAAVDIALLARFYERFADHAVSVAHQVVYLVTGETP
jgi:phosphate transport system protein